MPRKTGERYECDKCGAELVYTNYAGKPEPELRTEYADGGFDRIGLVPGTEARVMEWISDRRASAA